MQELCREYTLLFNAVSDAAGRLREMEQQLIDAQLAAEEAYLSAE